MRVGVCVLCFLLPIPVCAAAIRVSLADVEESACANSPRLKAARDEASAASARADAQFAAFFPKISLDGNYRYNAVVPEITLPFAGARVQKLSDNAIYSIGPSLSWTLWDSGAVRFAWEGAQAAARAKAHEMDATRRQVLLAGRTAYVQATLAAEQVRMVSDALELARAQYADISLNFTAGTKSRMDKLSSHQEVLARTIQLSQARSELAVSLRELSAVTGNVYCKDTCIPSDSRARDDVYDEIAAPNMAVTMDSIGDLERVFGAYRGAKMWRAHPGVAALNELAESARLAAKSASTGLWPKIQLSARTSLDYPNGPEFKEFVQNSFGANLAWPLFDAGATKNRVLENNKTRDSAINRGAQAGVDIAREWEKTNDRILHLKEQEKINAIALREADELASITYKAYTAGSLSYMEVQNANYRTLEAKIRMVKTKAQIFANLAIMASLADEEKQEMK